MRRATAAVLAALSLTVAACGSDDGSGVRTIDGEGNDSGSVLGSVSGSVSGSTPESDSVTETATDDATE